MLLRSFTFQYSFSRVYIFGFYVNHTQDFIFYFLRLINLNPIWWMMLLFELYTCKGEKMVRFLKPNLYYNTVEVMATFQGNRIWIWLSTFYTDKDHSVCVIVAQGFEEQSNLWIYARSNPFLPCGIVCLIWGICFLN